MFRAIAAVRVLLGGSHWHATLAASRSIAPVATKPTSLIVSSAVSAPSLRSSSTVPRVLVRLAKLRGGGAMKTKSAVKKRFRVNGGGLLVRKQSGKRHLNISKSRKRVNALGKNSYVVQPSIRKRYLRMLGM